jgi:hypothetical protein
VRWEGWGILPLTPIPHLAARQRHLQLGLKFIFQINKSEHHTLGVKKYY